MSNDLPTRLRALADMHYPAKLTVVLREAADALEAEETRRMMLNTSNGEWSKRFHALEQERDALKAKLVEAGALRANAETGWTDTLDHLRKAEAEAAALREALTPLAMDDETAMSFEGPYFAITIRDALSQPGPGASYQARMRKLERVLEIANQLGCRITAEGGHGLPVHALVLDLAEAVAPLKEKP